MKIEREETPHHRRARLAGQKLGQLVREGLATQREIGDDIRVSSSTVSSWILGHSVPTGQRLDDVEAFVQLRREEAHRRSITQTMGTTPSHPLPGLPWTVPGARVPEVPAGALPPITVLRAVPEPALDSYTQHVRALAPPGYVHILVAAGRAGIHESTIGQWCIKGKIPNARKVNRFWFIPESEVPKLIDRYRYNTSREKVLDRMKRAREVQAEEHAAAKRIKAAGEQFQRENAEWNASQRAERIAAYISIAIAGICAGIAGAFFFMQ